ncbi:SusD/RagB family nutrient-binding outer membrane lipoprotein [Olivibacter sp. LS-1]|uniref:SusD/RagB family nutrient-binding outer membrane lipoprotein n=1 Tax=unclassified Olivibacter TaxID=2632301 RepID=UPI0011EA9627|nr:MULTISPECIES: SusD/RagB family nutrient-binding outer membrane lipoprotein [unclassified Olivibacter]MDM8175120.1 SusD/RagB family nutrient-binding outer membrane lipoprotein [Olivibacter sp. 47]QEL01894.1 SusD/RagB family nutrient-binding outer membrane lipoprotein [Olivibacter sp. LS-1]
MKKSVYILLLSIVFTSCKKWLDINENPSSPNSTVPAPEQRLPPIIAQFADGYESAGTRVAFLAQQLAVTYANNNNWNLTRWYSNVSSANWPWQSWYVNTAVNIQPLIEASEKVGAYHYIGAAKIMKAWGFGYLADFYGMLPYDEFDIPGNLTPRFDDGAYVQGKVIALLDEAIADLQKSQEITAPDLAEGDILNGGKVENWIRLAYGLKARFLNHLTKKADYNPQAVLDALASAPQSDEQSSIMQYVDEEGVADNSKAALQYVNIGSTGRITKLYYDYLSNNYTGAPTGNNNMEDPRMDLLIPRMENREGQLVRTQFVDMSSDLPKAGPSSYNYSASSDRFSNKDSVYVQLRMDPTKPQAGQRILSTGSWYTQRGGKGLLLTNAEMRFIEAEVRLRLGQSTEALTAYKAGIRSHMSIMGITPTVIEQFLSSSSVIQNAGDLTMSHIMIQKYIALSYSPEVWCDLRRMNYCTDASGSYNETVGIYKGFKRPSHVFIEAYPSPTDWPRRFAVPSYEINFNIEQVRKANPNAESPTYLNEPVWWDQP